MGLLVAFLPLLAFWGLQQALGPAAALGLGAAVSAVVVGVGLSRGRAQPIEVTVSLLLLLLFAASLLSGAPVAPWTGLFVYAALALFALGSVLIGRPFTEAYGRERAPPEVWTHAGFRRAHRIVSLAWACAFALLGTGELLPGADPLLDLARGELLPFAVLAAGPVLSERYVVRVMSASL